MLVVILLLQAGSLITKPLISSLIRSISGSSLASITGMLAASRTSGTSGNSKAGSSYSASVISTACIGLSYK